LRTLKALLVALTAVVGMLVVAPAPAQAAVEYYQTPVLICNSSPIIFHTQISYSIASGRRLSVNRVDVQRAWLNDFPKRYYGVSVTVRNGSGAIVHYEATGGGFNREVAGFWWDPSYHVSTQSAPMRVTVVGEFRDTSGNPVRRSCTWPLWA
jgi:hypothetical protein